MCFMTLEDLQGSIDVVVFPSVWEKFSQLLVLDRIVMVDGRVDQGSGEPKLLAESIGTEFTQVQGEFDPQPLSGDDRENEKEEDTYTTDIIDAENQVENSDESGGINQSMLDVETGEEDDDDINNSPPPPDPFPPDWEVYSNPFPGSYDDETQTYGERGEIHPEKVEQLASSPDDKVQGKNYRAEVTISNQTPSVKQNSQIIGQGKNTENNEKLPVIPTLPLTTPHYLVPPKSDHETEDKAQNVRMLTIILRSSGDKTRDVLRIRWIHGIITSFPGNDRFAIHIYEKGHGHLLEFPNFTTDICSELLTRIKPIVGAENIRIETITFQ